MVSKKDLEHLEFRVPVRPLSEEERAQSQRLSKLLRDREKALKERKALKDKDLH